MNDIAYITDTYVSVICEFIHVMCSLAGPRPLLGSEGHKDGHKACILGFGIGPPQRKDNKGAVETSLNICMDTSCGVLL